jgi:hypothetical protein
MEDIIDNYPKQASRRGDGDAMSDIWSSSAIQSLLGPDKELFFVDGPEGETSDIFLKTCAFLAQFPVQLDHRLGGLIPF